MGAFIVLMIPETDRTSDAFAGITPRIVDDLRRINGRRPVIAQSAPCSKLLDYASAWRKMVRVLRWGLENGSEGLLGVPDAGAFGLLADIVDHRVTRDYVRNVLGPVRAYDKKHTTQFFPTLQRWSEMAAGGTGGRRDRRPYHHDPLPHRSPQRAFRIEPARQRCSLST